MNRCEVDIKEMCYIIPRYKAHMIRTVKSTSGIECSVVGQQASGDITTADDNSGKTIGFMANVYNELVYQNIIDHNKNEEFLNAIESKKIGIDITGDDTGFMCKIIKNDYSTIEEVYNNQASKFGWNVKAGSFSITTLVQDGNSEYLSHSVKRRSIYSRNFYYTSQFAMLVRPRQRAIAKAMFAPEIEQNIGVKLRSKLASKYLSLMMTSIGMPELIAIGMLGLITVRSSASDYIGSYAWAGIKANTVADLDINKMVRLQTGVEFEDIRFDWVQLFDGEEEYIRLVMDEIIVKMKEAKETYGLQIEDDLRSLKVIRENKWNVRAAIKSVEMMYKKMDKASYISKNKLDCPWWEINEETILPQENTSLIGEVRGCGHVTIPKCKVKTEFDVIVKCKDCYSQDIEQRYEGINMMLERINDNNKTIESEQGEEEDLSDKTQLINIVSDYNNF
jgi:hypothetical protein